ncbi:SPRY domain-containing SOCS box protein 3 [Bulinus truncatus]|nr:SPRY domain-containing SOCS box protein 3 [Bulinus truncatus]
MATEYILALCLSEESAEPPGAGVKDESKEIIRQRNISCPESWHWKDSHEDGGTVGVSLQCDQTRTAVTFHPNWSNGTAGVRATAPLVGDVNYWEIHVGDRVFGTSLMFGVTTKRARLQSNEFKNLIGEDANGWGLSHKGFVYHNGVSTYYCKPFKEYTPVVVGILLDVKKAEITYFKDGLSLENVSFSDDSSIDVNGQLEAAMSLFTDTKRSIYGVSV